MNIDYKLNADYPNYRTFKKAVMRRSGTDKKPWGPGYIAPEVKYSDGKTVSKIQVRYEDITFLTSDKDTGIQHIRDLLEARSGNMEKCVCLEKKYNEHLKHMRFDLNMKLTENEYVVPCTSEKYFSEELISHKGTMLLRLTRKDYPVPDFCILDSRFSQLDKEQRIEHVRNAVNNLEKLTGNVLGDPDNPLVFALRCAMPKYIPGLMPTFLNVGVTEDVFAALSRKHGELVASKILLNNLKTIYGLLYRDSPDYDRKLVRDCLKTDDMAEILLLNSMLKKHIGRIDNRLLEDPFYQTIFFVDQAIDGFEQNSDLFYTFIKNRESFPSLIL